jgi:type IV pilus assembly protein PilB
VVEVAANIKKPLGQRLLDKELITEAQLNLALNESKSKGVYLGEALENLGILSQDIIALYLADESGAEIIDLKRYPIELDAIDLVPYELAKRYQILPLSRKNNILKAAMADTLNVIAIEALEMATGLSVDVLAAAKNEIFETIEQYYAKQDTYDQIIKGILSKGADYLDKESGEILPIIRLVDLIVSKAIKSRATDIHFEPDLKVLRVRLRVDGVMHQEVLMPKELQPAVAARLKIMGSLDITENRLPMDGRITFKTGTRSVDLRISTLPTSNGETIVLRVLDKERIGLNLEALEFSDRDKEIFREILKSPNGLILVTGPTGSGKTSTLYAALGIVSTTEKNVLTLEDPIEYELPLIRQTPVNPDIGMDFPTGLRSMLRQDPDIIMVGEIRDSETAHLAVRAALTGHLVLSTLHTNSAAGAIPRLVDMGLAPYLVSSSLKAIIAQRLVRRICRSCRTEIPDANEYLSVMGVKVKENSGYRLYRGTGCKGCGKTGYHGRLGIYEIMKIDVDFHELIVRNAGVKEIERLARKKGMRKMTDDGFQKALKGLTTLEEVLKITSE